MQQLMPSALAGTSYHLRCMQLNEPEHKLPQSLHKQPNLFVMLIPLLLLLHCRLGGVASMQQQGI